MSGQNSGDVNQPAGETISPARGEKTENDLRDKPLLVPWTWADYFAARYLAGNMKLRLNDVGIMALHRGLKELAAETVADHIRKGKPVPQRLALLAHGEFTNVRAEKAD